ncbi:MAG: hypothetical protein M1815_001889 [Lichina confinis]|nr:MAG: hypothetical protein M1815_001889 [Lichina confinis]
MSSEPRHTVPWSIRYLQIYNLLSSLAWVILLGRVVLLVPLVGFEHVHGGAGTWLRWTQTTAGLEVLHSLTGLVRSSPVTTVIQVASRFLLVWFIAYPFPDVARSPVYTCMILAWSLTEVVRYTYFYRLLSSSRPSSQQSAAGLLDGWLTWLRYNTFYILYPLGIASEAYLIYLALEPASEIRHEFSWTLKSVLLAYIPGSYVMYNHMMTQRRRVIRGKQPTRGGGGASVLTR